MNSINENQKTCVYIYTKGKFINQRCGVKKICGDEMCMKHYKQENLRKEKQTDETVLKEKNTNDITNNIIFKLKKLIKEYNIDTIELKNILNIIEEEEPEPEPKPEPKIIEKTKDQQVDELVEIKLNKLFKKYFYDNGDKVREYFEDMDGKNEEYKDDDVNYKPKKYEDKYYKSFELELYKLYKIKYRNNIEIFNTLKLYIDREFFIHILIDENDEKDFLKHKIFDELMRRNEYIIEDDDEKLPPITDEIKTKTINYLRKTDNNYCSLYATAIAFNKDVEYIQKLYDENGRKKHDGTYFATIKKVVNILSNDTEVLSDITKDYFEEYKRLDETKNCCRNKSFLEQCGSCYSIEPCRYCRDDYNCIKKDILKTKQTEKQFIKNNPTGRFLVSSIGHSFVIDNGVSHDYSKSSSGRRKIIDVIKIQ